MTEHSENDLLDEQDVAVLAGLGRVLEAVDPVPSGLVDRTLFALTLEGLHTEVMRLHRAEAPAFAVRADDPDGSVGARTITFVADEVTVMISLSSAPAGGVRIDGWSAPATRFAVQLYRPDRVQGTETDDDGSFVLPEVAPGPASLVLRRLDGSGPAVSTPVIDL